MSFGSKNDRQKKYREYVLVRREFPKKDVTFLNREGRAKRVCSSEQDMAPFLKGLLSLADAAEKQGGEVVCSLDVEEDFVVPNSSDRKEEPFFFHKRQLRQEGLSEDAIKDREKEQAKLTKAWAAIKNAKTKKNRRQNK